MGYLLLHNKIPAGIRWDFDFLSHPTIPHPTKAPPKNKKLTQHYFRPSPDRFSTQSSQYQNWKANKCSILMVIESGPPVSDSSTRIFKIYAPTDSEHKLYRTGIKNWLPIRFNLGSSNHISLTTSVITTTLCWNAIGESLQVL